MSRREEEQLQSTPIPKNFADGTTFLGIEIKWFNILQGIILGLIPVIIALILNSFLIFYNAFSFWMTIVVLAVVLFILGFTGIDGITIGEYLYNIMMFKKKRRRTYYNPRVKTELKSSIAGRKDKTEMLPRDKIMAILDGIKAKTNLKDQEEAHKNESFELQSDMMFEDDFKVFDKPEEYMTDDEIKAKKKALAKQEKQKAKAERKTKR